MAGSGDAGDIVPYGRMKLAGIRVSVVLTGLGDCAVPVPTDKSVGYFQMFLRNDQDFFHSLTDGDW